MGMKIEIEAIGNGFIVDALVLKRYKKQPDEDEAQLPDLNVVKTFAGTHREVTRLVQSSLKALEIAATENPDSYAC